MDGGVIGGYCATGRLMTATAPARVMTTDNTAAKIGRSIKKCENRMGFSRLFLGEPSPVRGRVTITRPLSGLGSPALLTSPPRSSPRAAPGAEPAACAAA